MRMGEGRGVHRVLVGKPEGKRPLGRPRRRWEDNIKMDLQEVGGGCGDWIELAQDIKKDIIWYVFSSLVVKSRRMRWVGHAARMGEGRGVHRVLVGKTEGKRPLGRPRRRWEDNIKMDLLEVGVGCGDWIELAQDRERLRALVSMVMNFRVP